MHQISGQTWIWHQTLGFGIVFLFVDEIWILVWIWGFGFVKYHLDLDLGFEFRHKICISDLYLKGFVDLVLDLALDLFSDDTNLSNRFGDTDLFLIYLN